MPKNSEDEDVSLHDWLQKFIERKNRRREKVKEYRRKHLNKETPEERKLRLQKDRENKRQRIKNETPEQREKRLKRDRECKQRRLLNETFQQRQIRLQKEREHKRKKREAELLEKGAEETANADINTRIGRNLEQRKDELCTEAKHIRKNIEGAVNKDTEILFRRGRKIKQRKWIFETNETGNQLKKTRRYRRKNLEMEEYDKKEDSLNMGYYPESLVDVDVLQNLEVIIETED